MVINPLWFTQTLKSKSSLASFSCNAETEPKDLKYENWNTFGFESIFFFFLYISVKHLQNSQIEYIKNAFSQFLAWDM